MKNEHDKPTKEKSEVCRFAQFVRFDSDTTPIARRCDENISQNGAHRLEKMPMFFILKRKKIKCDSARKKIHRLFTDGEKQMKEKDEMFSVDEILKSKEFEREAPEGFKYLTRRFRRETSTTAEPPSRKETHSIKDIDRRRYR